MAREKTIILDELSLEKVNVTGKDTVEEWLTATVAIIGGIGEGMRGERM